MGLYCTVKEQRQAGSGAQTTPVVHVLGLDEEARRPKHIGTREEADDVVLKYAEPGSKIADLLVLKGGDKAPTLLYSATKQTHLILKKGTPFALFYGAILRLSDSVDVQVTYVETALSRDVETLFAPELEAAKSEIAQIDGDDATCYICWNAEDEKEDFVVSPCGNCTGSTRYVHLSCLLRWIEKNRLGHCPVCKSSIPGDFGPSPPFIEFTVLEKYVFRRNIALEQNIVRVSLAQKEKLFLGTRPDGSLLVVEAGAARASDAHCYITYDALKHRFYIVDGCESLCCNTMLRLNTRYEVALQEKNTNDEKEQGIHFLVGGSGSSHRCIVEVSFSRGEAEAVVQACANSRCIGGNAHANDESEVVVQDPYSGQLLAGTTSRFWLSLVLLAVAVFLMY